MIFDLIAYAHFCYINVHAHQSSETIDLLIGMTIRLVYSLNNLPCTGTLIQLEQDLDMYILRLSICNQLDTSKPHQYLSCIDANAQTSSDPLARQLIIPRIPHTTHRQSAIIVNMKLTE